MSWWAICRTTFFRWTRNLVRVMVKAKAKRKGLPTRQQTVHLLCRLQGLPQQELLAQHPYDSLPPKPHPQ